MFISKQKVHLLLRLSFSLAILGTLFKILRVPHTFPLLIIGTLGTAIFYSVQFYQKQSKALLDYSKLFLLISFLVHYSFRVFHLAYGNIFTFIFQGALVIVVIAYIMDTLIEPSDSKLESDQSKASALKNTLNHLLYTFSGIGIIVGAFFKILHWQFGFVNGNLLLALGLLAAIVSVFIPTNKSESK